MWSSRRGRRRSSWGTEGASTWQAGRSLVRCSLGCGTARTCTTVSRSWRDSAPRPGNEPPQPLRSAVALGAVMSLLSGAGQVPAAATGTTGPRTHDPASPISRVDSDGSGCRSNGWRRSARGAHPASRTDPRCHSSVGSLPSLDAQRRNQLSCPPEWLGHQDSELHFAVLRARAVIRASALGSQVLGGTATRGDSPAWSPRS